MLEFATLFFVRSGYINVNYGFLRNVGVGGAYWSCSNVASSTAYDFYFDITDVYPSRGPRGRYYGFSLRCLQE